jgi:hypothetical protein
VGGWQVFTAHVMLVTWCHMKFHNNAGYIYHVTTANIEKLPPVPNRATVVNVSKRSDQSTKMAQSTKTEDINGT